MIPAGGGKRTRGRRIQNPLFERGVIREAFLPLLFPHPMSASLKGSFAKWGFCSHDFMKVCVEAEVIEND